MTSSCKLLSRLLPLCAFGLSAFGAPALAQSEPFQKPEVRGGRADRELRSVVHATYDVQRDRVQFVRRAVGSQMELGTPPCFDNSEIVVPVDPQYTVANIGEETLNWGFKNCPGASRLRSFTIAYRSEAIDTSQGGPGAALSIALYTGTTGFGNPGTQIFRRTFTGLPSFGAPASSDVVYEHNGTPFQTGSAPMVFLTIDFGTEPLPLADGNFGWGFLQMDGDTGPVLVRAPKPILGTADAMDIYFPGPAQAGSYLGTFNYGGCSGIPFRACANMYVQLDEIANNEVALATVLNGSGVNPQVLSQIFPARLGQVWAAGVSGLPPTGAGNPPSTLLFVSGAAFGPVASPFGEVLIAPSARIGPAIPGQGGYSVAIPADVSLVGVAVFVQAAVIPPAAPSMFLTNALRVRMGF